jgi:hypothetical protein
MMMPKAQRINDMEFGDLCPEKAGVGGSIPSLATICINYFGGSKPESSTRGLFARFYCTVWARILREKTPRANRLALSAAPCEVRSAFMSACGSPEMLSWSVSAHVEHGTTLPQPLR